MLIDMRVVSFCHYLQGPACTQYLADMGADVIKVEPPEGAFERHWSGGKSHVEGVSAFLLCANRNKRSLAIDLKRPAGREVMFRLFETADVIVENFRPGVMDRLGLGYAAVAAVRPDIIYVSATGLGADGPDSGRPGQDLLMQARSGLIAATGNDETGPVCVGAAVVDQHGAALMAMGILGAYVRRLRTGEGTRIEANLLASAIDLQTEALTKYLAKGADRRVMRRGRNVGSWYHDAPYGVYRLADAHIVMSMNDPKRVAAALASPALEALASIDRYDERDRYARAVAAELAGRAFAEVARAFDEHAIWYERVRDYDDLKADPQVLHNRTFAEVDVRGRRVSVVNHPLRYDGRVPEVKGFPLEAGQHSREILAEAGYGEGEIDRLVKDGVVVEPKAGAGDR